MFGVRQSKRIISQYKEKYSKFYNKLSLMINDYNLYSKERNVKKQMINFNKIVCLIITNFLVIIKGANDEIYLENLLNVFSKTLKKTEKELKEIVICEYKLYIKFNNNINKVIDLCNNYFIYKINILQDKLIPDLLINLRQYIY